MYIGSPTLDPGPSVSTLYVLWSCISCLVLSRLLVFQVSPMPVSFSCPTGGDVDRRCIDVIMGHS